MAEMKGPRPRLPQLAGLAEAAEALGLSTWTLRKWARDGRLPTIRLGRRRLVEVAVIERLVRDAREATA